MKNVKCKNIRKDNDIVIGIYAAKTDIFRKNAFAQIAAAAIFKNNKPDKNVRIDMIPLNKNAKTIAKLLDIEIDGISHSVPREKLMEHLANCDLSLYVTFTVSGRDSFFP